MAMVKVTWLLEYIGPVSGIGNDLLLCQRNSRLVTPWQRKSMRAMTEIVSNMCWIYVKQYINNAHARHGNWRVLFLY